MPSPYFQELRFKELEDEVNTLQNGLQVIEKARKWYFKRITAIQEEKLHLQNEDQYSLEQVIKQVKLYIPYIDQFVEHQIDI